MLLLNKKVLSSIFCGLMVSLFMATLLPTQALAAANAIWIDAATISYNGHTYKDDNIQNSNWQFKETDSADGCPDTINNFNYNATKGPYVSSKQNIHLNKQKPVPGGCSPDGVDNITLDDQPPGYNVLFTYTDGHNIQSVDGKKKYAYDDTSKAFLSTSDGTCKDFITVSGAKSDLQLTIRANTGGIADNATESLQGKYSTENRSYSGYSFYKSINSSGDVPLFDKTCHESTGIGTTADITNAGTAGTSTTAGGGNSSGDTPTCESQGNNLSWIICPIINMLADASTAMYTYIIAPWLSTDPIQIDSSKVIFQTWSSLRDIGNIVLVIAMLVIVFGQAIGGGMVNAYTAKKVLPRILIAAVLINISIYLVAAMVDVTNVLGHGLSTILTDAVTNGGGSTNLTINPGTQAALYIGYIAGAGGTIWVAAAATTAFLGTLVQAFLLFILLPAFLAFLGVVITLILRQGIITALIIVSPVAFALYCVPGGEKYLKKWWDYLFKALLLYPIIALVFGVANIMALTTNQAGRGDKNGVSAVVFQLSSILLLFIPIFLIPFAFKFAGGAISSLYGTFSGWNKRGSEAIKGSVNDPNSMRNRIKDNFAAERVANGFSAGAIGTRLNPNRLSATGRAKSNAKLSAIKQSGLETLRKKKEG
jgi:hypothetical protein